MPRPLCIEDEVIAAVIQVFLEEVVSGGHIPGTGRFQTGRCQHLWPVPATFVRTAALERPNLSVISFRLPICGDAAALFLHRQSTRLAILARRRRDAGGDRSARLAACPTR